VNGFQVTDDPVSRGPGPGLAAPTEAYLADVGHTCAEQGGMLASVVLFGSAERPVETGAKCLNA
jgi:hypothetical protein